jgi:hypothetical protein
VTKPRKSRHYPSDIRIVLRNAQITRFEIEDELEERKRHELTRERDIARDVVIKMYRDAQKRDALDRLDWGVRNFCDDLKASNNGRLPTPKGGRPRDDHRRLLIAIQVIEAIEADRANGGSRGAVDRAICQVAAKFDVTYRRVREIYYDRDPVWMRDLRVSLAMRGRALNQDEPAEELEGPQRPSNGSR